MKLRVKIGDQHYVVEIGDLNARPVQAEIDGEIFEVWPEEPQTNLPPMARPVPTFAAPVRVQPSASAGSQVITAPIPGTVISVAAQTGDKVIVGQELLVLEAMKMKNLIRSPRAGEIAQIKVQPGERVSQGQVLLEFCA